VRASRRPSLSSAQKRARRTPPRPGRLIGRARALLERSALLVDLSRYDEASASLERAASILSGRHPEGPVAALRHEAFLQTGHLHLRRARFGAARLSFSRALRAAEEHGLGDHAVARALTGLGRAARHTGQLAEAGRLYHRALRRLEAAEETSAPLVAEVLQDVGDLEHERRRFAEAERWARRGLEMRERSAGAAAVETGVALAGLALIVQARRRHDEAAVLYERALAILRRRLRDDHLEVVANLCRWAALEHRRGRIVTSRRLYRWAFPRLERLLGRDHPQVKEAAANFHALEDAIEAESRIKGGRPRLGVR
jgi:tetratricopeptide (TPR) repeat protein